jgi:hypothetical protein
MLVSTYALGNGTFFAQNLQAVYGNQGILTAISVETVKIVAGLNPPTATCTFVPAATVAPGAVIGTPTFDVSNGLGFAQNLQAVYCNKGILTAISVETVNVVAGLNPPTATCTFAK